MGSPHGSTVLAFDPRWADASPVQPELGWGLQLERRRFSVRAVRTEVWVICCLLVQLRQSHSVGFREGWGVCCYGVPLRN